MTKNQMNLQDNFLNQARKDNIQVTIYLTSGVQLRGFVKSFDSFTLLLEGAGKPSQLVYKHAIASIVPMRQVNGLAAAREEEKVTEQPIEEEIQNQE